MKISVKEFCKYILHGAFFATFLFSICLSPATINAQNSNSPLLDPNGNQAVNGQFLEDENAKTIVIEQLLNKKPGDSKKEEAAQKSGCTPAFYDGFESGSYLPTWTVGDGSNIKNVNTTDPAVGTYSLAITGAFGRHFKGLAGIFPAAQPSEMSWWLKPTSAGHHHNYVVVGDANISSNAGILFMYYNVTGGGFLFYVNGSNNIVVPVNIGPWYFIEIKDIDWTNKHFDIYIDGNLIQSDFPFRSQASTDIAQVHLYNFSSGSTGNWDDINIGCSAMQIVPTISQTDEDGDGTPDITDPCACGDPLNIIDGGGNITHFHDFVLVNSGPGETWQITALNSGAIFDAGLVAIPLNTVLPEISPGVYKLDLYHPSGVGFNVTVDRTAGGGPFPLVTGGTCNAAICGSQAIPTMGEWGLIILALLLLTFATVFMMGRKTAVAGFGTVSSNGAGIPFNKAAFGKMLAIVMVVLAAVFATAVGVFGYEMTTADLPGSLIAGPIAAYLLHMLIPQKKES